MAGGLDLLGGQMMNRFWGNKAEAQAEGVASDWRKHAVSLLQKLERADEKALFKQAEFDANDQVLKLALDALKKADPSSPILDKGTRDNLRRQHIAAALGTKGYKVDLKTGAVESKIR